MAAARRLVRRHYAAHRHPALRWPARLLAALAWPPAVLAHLWRIRRDRGPEAVPAARLPGALWAALRHNVLPGEYYAYELWRPAGGASLDDYLYSNEAPRLFKLINRPPQPDPIGDKLAFHDLCRAQGLPTPAVLAAFQPTGPLRAFADGVPPERHLFVKPRLGLAGLGAERLLWDGGGFAGGRGRRVGRSELSGYLTDRARAEGRTLLVQPLCRNHAGLGVAADAALATARLVTGRLPDGASVPIFGFIYVARSGAIASRHGHVALIDVASGRLAPAPPPERSGARHWRHWRNSGSWPLENDVLPDWAAAVRHAAAAHAACPGHVFVGWDIAFTDEGPMLLEGNAHWSADEFQSLSGTPLGHTRFAEILAAALEARPE